MSLCKVFVVAVLAGVPIGMAGCGSSSATNTTSSDATFTNGKLEAVLKAPVLKAAEGTRLALQDLKLSITSYVADPSSARIVGLAPNGIRVEVTIVPKDDKTSRIVISTGDIGDDKALTEAYAAIHKRVG
jgi:hypothetical protein